MFRRIVILLIAAAMLGTTFLAQAASSSIETLNKSALQGDIDTVKKISTEKNFNINAQDAEGMTVLMNAAISGNEPLIQLLLKKRPDLELKNKEGDTALAVALTNEQYPTAHALIKAGARVDVLVAGDEQNTLLIQAAKSDIETTKMIVTKDKSQLNKANAQGETPLMVAILFGQNKVVEYLVKSGANSLAKNKEGLTAKDLAKKVANEKALQLLQSKNGKS